MTSDQPVTLNAAARDLLASGPLAHVVTLNPDGSPHVTCTWVTLDDDTLLIAVLTLRQKIKNLRRDPRIVVSFEAQSKNAMGLTDYLVVHGEATITEGGAAALLQEQAHVYMGPGTKFPQMENPPPGYLVRIHIKRIWDHIGSGGTWSS